MRDDLTKALLSTVMTAKEIRLLSKGLNPYATYRPVMYAPIMSRRKRLYNPKRRGKR